MSELAAVVLAAGLSRRFERGRKLEFPVGGRPLLEYALAAAAAAGLDTLVVVTAPEDLASQSLARAHGATLAFNPEPARGLGRTLACGISALPPGVAAAFIVLGDMPCVAPATYRALAAAFTGPEDVVVPVYETTWGHPVLFGAARFAALAMLDGDRGARSVLLNAGAHLKRVEVGDPGIVLDVDTEADVASAERLLLLRASATQSYPPGSEGLKKNPSDPGG